MKVEEKKAAKSVKGNSHLKTCLVECGWGATRKKEGYLNRKYRRIMSRRGKKKALIAIGHDIIKAAYHVLKNETVYHEHVEQVSSIKKHRQIQHHLEKLKGLGIDVEITDKSNETIKI